MWIQLKTVKNIEIKGVTRRYQPGDWVEIGKQQALQWIADGSATIPQASRFKDLVGIPAAHVYTNNKQKTFGALCDINALQIFDTPPEMTSERVIIVDASFSISAAQIAIGLMLLETWECAAPLIDYKTLAAQTGSEAERDRTKAIIRDLRVPVYDTRLIFLRNCENCCALLSAWQQDEGDRRLAFLRALYTVKPFILALPATWGGVNIP